MHNWIKTIIAGLFFAGIAAGAEDFFFCNFNEMAARNGKNRIMPIQRGEHRTITGFGKSSRGVLFAMENLQDFQKYAVMDPLKPRPAILYTGLKNFPVQAGYCDLWLAPHFNQEHAYRGSKDTKLKLSYIFSLFTHAPGTSLVARSGKSVINAYIHTRQLNIQMTFTDGTQTILRTSLKNWDKGSFHRITLVWAANKQQLYVDRKLAAQSQAKGTLAAFNSLELGGRDVSLSFQGIIDDVKISSGKPIDTASPEFEGDPEKFKQIPTPALSGDWKTEHKTTAIKTEKKKTSVSFDFGGKSERPQTIRLSQTVPVRAGSYLRSAWTCRKIQWQHGSRADFILEFLGQDDKVLRRCKMDATLIPGYNSMGLVELSTDTASGKDISYFNYFPVPPKCSRVRLAVQFTGNPCQLELTSWKLREVDPAIYPWWRQPLEGKQLTYAEAPTFSDEEVRRHLARRPRAVSRLVQNNDRMEWYINGEKIPPGILHNPITGSYRRVTAFKSAGFKLFTSAIILGRAPYPDDYVQIWREDGSIDVSGMEKAVYRVLRENPDAYVIFNMIVCPPASWLKANRGELHPGKDGNPLIFTNCAFTSRTSKTFPAKNGETWAPSIHSRKFKEDVAAVLTKVMQKFEKTDASKAVAGIYLTGGDDGQFRAPVIPDSSPVALEAFRRYLKEKYKTPENLSAAWQKQMSWQDVVLPTAAQISDRTKTVFSEGQACLESDFRRFVAQECTDLKMTMRRAVKKAAPRLLTGGYDGASALAGTIWYGRGTFDLSSIIRDKGCDFLISLPVYNRGRDECLIPMGLKAYTGSMLLHKKLIISEMDIRNPEQPGLGFLYKSRNWQAVHNYKTFSELLKLYAGYAAAWGGTFHAYSMGRNYYSTPEAMAAWKAAAAIAAAAPGEPLGDDRIAVICDERSNDFFAASQLGHFSSESWNKNINHILWLSQVRFDAYLPDDLFHPDFKAPKIMLFSNMATVPPEKLAAIRKRFLREGRTLIYLGLPGILSGGKLSEISAAMGVQYDRPAKIRHRSLWVGPSKDPLLKNVSGFLYTAIGGNPLIHYGNAGLRPQKDLKALVSYQGTDICGMAVRRSSAGTEIFIGQPSALSPQLLRNVAKAVGIQPVTDGNDLMVRGGGLIVLGGSTGSGVRTVYYPQGVKKLTCLTGQKIIKADKKSLSFYLKYNECAVFKCER